MLKARPNMHYKIMTKWFMNFFLYYIQYEEFGNLLFNNF